MSVSRKSSASLPSFPLHSPEVVLTHDAGTTNKHRYVLASQSPSLRTSLASIPGLPIVHYNPRGVLVLSPPGVATVREKNKLEEERRMEGARVLEGIVDGGNVVGMSDAATTGNPGSGGTAGGAGPSKRNRPKAPNPLSVKKKKASSGGNAGQATGGGGETGKKRRRDSDDGGAEGEAIDAGGETVEGETDTAAEVGKRKKKRRRRGKGAVAAAIAEIRERGGVGSGSEENANEDSE
jgi:U3 small nucleolar RNA-associated protein 23